MFDYFRKNAIKNRANDEMLYEYVMEELFPDVDTEDYTDEMLDAYNDVESEYYSFNIEEFEGSDEEFNEYEKLW